ncbi:hypothetical protein Dsin_004364 [Dipteronia sinensis]|uniref:Uncharacterized protein n=1 Tax=Dipteronia sinensis TaxID=43782 RepID=A0AAE0B9G5_9ROSI|nr:hypothetical protein Dsin_004364 [Dipteronia sinensis]
MKEFCVLTVTGRRPVDRNRPENKQKLLDWVRAHLTDVKKFTLMIEPKLEGKYSLKSAQKLAAIANKCLSRQAKTHPTTNEVLELLNKIVENRHWNHLSNTLEESGSER